MTMELSDHAYVFHNPSGRTFHPKIYAATGAAMGVVYIGSSNMTRGGLQENYEAGIVCDLDLAQEGDQRFLAVVAEYIQRLIDDTEVCIPLTPEALAALIADPRYLVADEDARAREESGIADNDTDSDSVTDAHSPDTGLFGRTKFELRRAGAIASERGTREAEGGHRAAPGVSPVVGGRPTSVERRWYVELMPAHAQQPAAGSNHTGYMTLGKATHPIEFRTYFRREFFRDANWRDRGDGSERATIEFDLVIDAVHRGRVSFDVDYIPRFESGQGNRTNLLRWGPLNDYLRTHDHVGDYLTLERLSDGTYRMTIADQPTGPFIE